MTQHDHRDEVTELAVLLTGGRLTTGVLRVGDTVRRPMGPQSPFVHRLLRHLEAVGFEAAPRLVGVDEHGREMLNFIDGWVPPHLDHFADETLAAAARLLRRLHDATAGSELAAGHEVVCHNDPSPCNYVFLDGRPVAFIDFDHAAPGDRLRDVAYAGWLWTISADDGARHPRAGETTAADRRQLRPARPFRPATRRASPPRGEPRGRARPQPVTGPGRRRVRPLGGGLAARADGVAAGTRRHVPRGAGHGKLVVCSRSC